MVPTGLILFKVQTSISSIIIMLMKEWILFQYFSFFFFLY